MQRFPAWNITAVVIVVGIGLGIDNLALDIDHPIFALIAANIVTSFVQKLAPICGW